MIRIVKLLKKIALFLKRAVMNTEGDQNVSSGYTINEVAETPLQMARDFMYVGIERAIYQITLAFGLGIFFAPWSPGLFFLVLFLLGFELLYGMIVQKFTVEQLLIRGAIISSYFIGWLLGRIVIRDGSPMRLFFEDGFSQLGRPKHRHPCHKRDIYNNLASSRIAAGHDMVNHNGFRYVRSPIEIDPNQDYRGNTSTFDILADEWEQKSQEEVRKQAIPSVSTTYADTCNHLILRNDVFA